MNTETAFIRDFSIQISRQEIRRLLAGGKPHSPEVVATVIDLVRRGGHLESALAEVDRRTAAAGAAVTALPAGEVTDVFRALGDYLIERVDQARR